MISLEERPNNVPLCPHCDSQVKTMYYRLLSKWLGRRYVYFCSACQKVLGVSHRKGFFMG